jgi:YlmC/YmxH family sporulation protein
MRLRLSELNSKEIIDVDHGERLGLVGQADFLICENTGNIEALIYQPSSFLGMGKKKQETISIPWSSVCKIGPEMMIVQLKQRERGDGAHS